MVGAAVGWCRRHGAKRTPEQPGVAAAEGKAATRALIKSKREQHAKNAQIYDK